MMGDDMMLRNNAQSMIAEYIWRYIVYCIITIIIDLWFMWTIFHNKGYNLDYAIQNNWDPNKKKQQQQQAKDLRYAMKRERWKDITLQIEKSPFVILNIYSFLCSIIWFAVFFAFNMNIFMVIMLEIVNHFDARLLSLILFQLFFMYWSMIYMGYCPVVSSWHNFGDYCLVIRICKLNVYAAHVWRSLHLICSTLFVIISAEFDSAFRHRQINVVNANYLFHLFCTWMTIQGAIWSFTHIIISCFVFILIQYQYKQQSKVAPSPSKPVLKKKGSWIQLPNNRPVEWRIIPDLFNLFDLSLIILLLTTIYRFVTDGVTFFFDNDGIRRYIDFLISEIVIICVYLLFKYCKQYEPIWHTTYYWIIGKFTFKDHNRSNIFSYWIMLRDKQYSQEKWRSLLRRSLVSSSSSPMWIAFAIFVLFLSFILYGGKLHYLYSQQFQQKHQITTLNENNATYSCNLHIENYLTRQHMEESTYPICHHRFGNSANLNVLDFTLFTMVPYKDNKTLHINILDLWFGEGNWGKYEFFPELTENKTNSIVFLHISNEKHKYDIIAIRGTKDQSDVSQDLKMFTEIASIQFISFFVPLTSLLPDPFLRWIIWRISIRSTIRYDDIIYKYIKENDRLSSLLSKKKDDEHIIYLLGHSLGGGVAEIVASRFAFETYQNVISFGVSSPGSLWSSKKFLFDIDNLDRTSISIIPRRDVVPTIDRHGGLKQLIRCNQLSFAHCHFAWSSFCELMQSCSEKYVYQRNINLANCICSYKSGWGGIDNCCLN